MPPGEFQIGQKLGFMNWKNCFDGFRFDDNKTADNHVHPETGIDARVSINNRQHNLAIDG